MRCTERTTLRIDNNLKTRIQLLAIKNNFSMNKMFIYLLELGYRSYVERYEKDYEFKVVAPRRVGARQNSGFEPFHQLGIDRAAGIKLFTHSALPSLCVAVLSI